MATAEHDIGTSEGFLLVCSVTSRESFDRIVTFYQQVLRFKEEGSFSAIILANKCDLAHERKVGIHGMPSFFTCDILQPLSSE